VTSPTFDIILYGATSFVGQIMTRYMHETFTDGSVKWAIAGRSLSKLEKVSAEIGLSDTQMITADAHDEAALSTMAAQTKVVVSTVGPYALYGDTLVKVCAQSGTHYCDLTGEPQWIRKMQEAYGEAAKKSGARMVHCCGFDSIPSDLGVHFLQKHAKKKYGQTCSKIDMRVVSMKGGASGGTIASMINLVKEASKDKALRKELTDPYSLCPPDHDFTTKQAVVKTAYDEDYGAWIGPFIMEGINSRVVHRSNALSGKAYGDDFLCQEAMVTGKGGRGRRRAMMTGLGMGALMAGIAIPPTRWVMEKFVLPKPGEGPSPEEQLNGSFDLVFIGATPNGKTLKCRVTGDRDPGYGSTAKMLAQAAACLAQDIPKSKKGGFWTPATLMGDKLIERLTAHSGLTFEMAED